jgi:hypothetical protein
MFAESRRQENNAFYLAATFWFIACMYLDISMWFVGEFENMLYVIFFFQ